MTGLRLDADRVVLRDFTGGDANDTAAIVGDDRVTHWLAFASMSPEASANFAARAVDSSLATPRTEYYLAIAAPADEQLIGFVRLALSGASAAKIGYAVHADHQGLGYATAAVRRVVQFAFDDLKLHRITAAVGPQNVASLGVLEHLGFRFEGRLRDHVHTNGAWRDSLLYSVLEDDWRASVRQQSQ